jgi:beta-mannosidase
MRFISQSLILIPLFALLACQHAVEKSDKIDLSGSWQFQKQGDSHWLPAIIPGTVQTDLLSNHLIEDLYYSDNELKNKWIENENWVYRKIFVVDKSEQNQNAELVFEGLDTYATVFLNDRKILTADNMFRTYKLDVDSFLIEGENELKIIFESPIQKAIPVYDALSYRLPADNDRNDKQTSVFTRKAPYQYGWDWGQRYVTMGIWRPVYLQFWKEFKVIENRLHQIHLSDAQALVAWNAQVFSEAETQLSCTINLGKEELVNREFKLIKGVNQLADTFQIENPKRWWPNGYGEQNLYSFELELKNENQRFLAEKKLGFRTIEFVSLPDSIGKSFYFEVNGFPIYAKGANYIPQDNFLHNVDSLRYTALIKSVKLANMNMLRVWGGGVYESDLFYDLCDKNGILVWQDFMFACSLYPGDSAFLKNVEMEARDQIARLRDHPSLAFWCGNNEINELWFNWGYQKKLGYSVSDSLKIWNDYQKLFQHLLPTLVKELNPETVYWVSSPMIGWGHTESLKKGDSHYWGVWWGKEPFEVYEKKVPRFASEFGFQSFPQMSTLYSFADSSQMFLESDAMQAHQKSSIGNQTIVEYMERDFPVPENFEDFVYVSQLVQAYGVGKALEAQRQAKPRSMGSLYWQLNDCWPGISWSGLDYFGNWKALHYEAQHDFATFLISINGHSVYIVSDSLDSVDALLQLRMMSFGGELLFEKEIKIKLGSNSSRLVYTIPSEIRTAYPANQFLIDAQLHVAQRRLARNTFYFLSPKDLLLSSNAEPEFKLSEGKLLVWSRNGRLIKNIYLQTDTHLSSNYFDLLPGDTVIISTDKEIKSVSDIKWKSLNTMKYK